MRLNITGDIIANGDKWIYDWLDMDAACPKDILAALEKANGQPVDVYINSGGGDVFAGNEIYETLRDYPGEVTIHVIYAASAASVIMCARRSVISPAGMVMVHNVSASARGDYHDMDKSSEILQQANRALAAAYTAKSGRTEAEVLAMMDRETWLTGQQAVDAGLVDAVSQPERLTAAGPGSLPPAVVERIRNTVKNPFQAQQHKNASGTLESLKLKGEARVKKADYQAKRAALMAKAEALINASKMEEFEAARKEIDALDEQFDTEANALANLQAMYDNPCVTDLAAHSVEPKGPFKFLARWTSKGDSKSDSDDKVPHYGIYENYSMEDCNMEHYNMDMKNTAEIKAFQQYLARGCDMRSLTADAQGAIITTGAGAVMPESIFRKLITSGKYSDLLHRATMFTQAGAGIVRVPIASHNTAAWKTEAQAVDPTNPTMSSIDLGGKELMRVIKYSESVEAMSIDDFSDYMVALVSSETVETLEDAFINGSTKTGQPHDGLAKLEWTEGKNMIAADDIRASDVAKGLSLFPQRFARNVLLMMNANTAYNTVGLFKGTSEYAYNMADGASRFMSREIVINEHCGDDTIYIVDPKELYVRFAMAPQIKADSSVGFYDATKAVRCLTIVDYAWNPEACVKVCRKAD